MSRILLQVRIEGPAVQAGQIALRDLVHFGRQFQTALDRVARVLAGQISTRRGQPPYDNDTAWAWARIRAIRQKQGHPIAPQDAWIAAGALRHNCPLITHNADDYRGIPGLQIISEPD